MSTHTTGASFAPGAQDQPAGQAASGAKSRISRRMAERHGALFLRLEPLARQAEAMAAKHKLKAVPEDMRLKAEAALYESHAFCLQRRRCLTPAAPHFGALSTQLGAVLAEMVAFETSHSQWDKARKARMWLVEGGAALPVRRLLPKNGIPTADEDAQRAAYMGDLRIRLAERIDQFNRR